ncbi:MAG: PEP-CTERM sorting domain-containing protein [Armatimonadota bacterium]
MSRALHAIAFWLAFAGIPAVTWAGPRYTLIDLGGFDPAQKSAALGVDNAGRVVGWAFLQTGQNEYSQRAFLWENGTTYDLGALPGEQVSCAVRISDSGWVAGQSGYAAIHAAAWYTGISGQEAIYDLGTLGGTHSFSFGLNDAAQIVGQSEMPGNRCGHAFLWTLQDGMTDLGTLPISPNTTGTGINNLGQVVGYTGSGTDSRAFVWENGTIRYIDADAEQVSEATFAMDINDSGLVVGSMYVEEPDGVVLHACIWDLLAGARTDLGVLAGFGDTSLHAVNALGHAVGLAIRQTTENHAILYESGSLIDLNSLIDPGSGWVLNEARDINDKGWIVGAGVSPSGQHHGFLLVPVPEPATLSLLTLSGLALLGRRRLASA